MSAEEPEADDGDDALVEALRGAWRELPPPSTDRPLADEDPHTQRAVSWMRSAWLALPVPAAVVPGAAHRIGVHARWRRVAAAAALLLALGVPVLVFTRHRDRSQPSAVDPSATIVAIDAHHLELRSGPVRLYLLTDSIPPHPEVPR